MKKRLKLIAVMCASGTAFLWALCTPVDGAWNVVIHGLTIAVSFPLWVSAWSMLGKEL